MELIAENLSKWYFRKSGEANHFYAVKSASLALTPGTVTLLTGRSGSGKTTLMNMLAGLLTPSEGIVRLGETDLWSMDDRRRSRLRNEKIAVVPQGRSALDALTVWENILLPGRLYGDSGHSEDAGQWLERLGIAHLRDARPAELSGGELRRVAIARALTSRPDVLLADEPTGDLDDENTRIVLEIFRETAHERRQAVLLISHEDDARAYADCCFRMEQGTLDTSNP